MAVVLPSPGYTYIPDPRGGGMIQAPIGSPEAKAAPYSSPGNQAAPAPAPTPQPEGPVNTVQNGPGSITVPVEKGSAAYDRLSKGSASFYYTEPTQPQAAQATPTPAQFSIPLPGAAQPNQPVKDAFGNVVSSNVIANRALNPDSFVRPAPSVSSLQQSALPPITIQPQTANYPSEINTGTSTQAQANREAYSMAQATYTAMPQVALFGTALAKESSTLLGVTFAGIQSVVDPRFSLTRLTPQDVAVAALTSEAQYKIAHPEETLFGTATTTQETRQFGAATTTSLAIKDVRPGVFQRHAAESFQSVPVQAELSFATGAAFTNVAEAGSVVKTYISKGLTESLGRYGIEIPSSVVSYGGQTVKYAPKLASYGLGGAYVASTGYNVGTLALQGNIPGAIGEAISGGVNFYAMGVGAKAESRYMISEIPYAEIAKLPPAQREDALKALAQAKAAWAEGKTPIKNLDLSDFERLPEVVRKNPEPTIRYLKEKGIILGGSGGGQTQMFGVERSYASSDLDAYAAMSKEQINELAYGLKNVWKAQELEAASPFISGQESFKGKPMKSEYEQFVLEGTNTRRSIISGSNEELEFHHLVKTGKNQVGVVVTRSEHELIHRGDTHILEQLRGKLENYGIPENKISNNWFLTGQKFETRIGVVPGTGKITYKGEKVFEAHPIEMLNTNIDTVLPWYKPRSFGVRETPEGLKVVDLRIQYGRKVIGGFAEGRAKDIPDVELIKQQFGKPKETKGGMKGTLGFSFGPTENIPEPIKAKEGSKTNIVSLEVPGKKTSTEYPSVEYPEIAKPYEYVSAAKVEGSYNYPNKGTVMFTSIYNPPTKSQPYIFSTPNIYTTPTNYPSSKPQESLYPQPSRYIPTPVISVPTPPYKTPSNTPYAPYSPYNKMPIPTPAPPYKPQEYKPTDPQTKRLLGIELPKEEKKKGYSLFIRRYGKFKEVGTGYTREAALDVGTQKVVKSIAATFKIVPTGGEATRANIASGVFAAYAPTLRPPKKFAPDTFVQKRGTRLSSGGEISDIQAARRNKLRL
jgi:hypothetical protein